jgi:aminoglycoside phosphotransferase family enzyme
MSLEASRRLVESLRRPEAYAHPVGAVELKETHISWVLLTGDFVYKIKKPVKLDFLDFSTLERRRFFCEEELRLNRRFAMSCRFGARTTRRTSVRTAARPSSMRFA